MKSVIQNIGLLAAMLLTVFTASASFKVDGLYYNVLSEEDRTVEVTYHYYDSDNSSYVSGDLVIPQRILYSGKTYKVTAIEERAFRYCSSLTSVEIPNSVTKIEPLAFSDCSGLTSVTIPNSVTKIYGTSFNGCSNLTDINVSEENTSFCSIDGILYSKDASLLIECGGGKEGAVTIPNSVTQIGEYAFDGCSGLTSVTIPNSVTEIGSYAFSYCSGLTSVTIPNSVTEIGSSAFFNCSGLTSVEIPNSVTEIEQYTFSNCRGLKSVTISNSVTQIGSYAFEDCSGLKSITIGNSVTSIGKLAFSGCSAIAEIYCKPETPPSVRGYNFSDEVLMNAKLYVPVGCKGAYEKVDPWRNFWNIEEMDFTSSIGEVVAGGDVEVSVSDGVITLSGNDEGATVEIFDMQGRKVFGGVGNVSASLPAGVYIVRMAGKTLKARI